MFRNEKALFTALGLFLLLMASRADADVKPGIRGGAYFDAGDAFLGGEILAPISPKVYINPNFEYVFADNASFFTLNFDAHYDLPTHGSYWFWVGGGLAIVHFDPDGPREGDTDAGLNLFAGVGFDTDSRFVPYIQPKLILSDNSEFSLAFGLRF